MVVARNHVRLAESLDVDRLRTRACFSESARGMNSVWAFITGIMRRQAVGVRRSDRRGGEGCRIRMVLIQTFYCDGAIGRGKGAQVASDRSREGFVRQFERVGARAIGPDSAVRW